MKIESMDRMFLPVGQGAFYCERFYNAEHGRNLNVVYDCGTLSKESGKTSLELIKGVVDKYFQEDNDKVIDALFISHLHEDHFNGVEYLVKKCKIRRIYLPQTDPLELKLMQLYYVAHHTASGSGGDSLGGHFLECNDLERDFPEALQKVIRTSHTGTDDDSNVPEVVPVGITPIVLSETVFEGLPARAKMEGNFAKWKYKTFSIKNDKAAQRVRSALTQLIHDKSQIYVNEVTPEHVAELIRECRADKAFRRAIRRMFKSAIDDFHANSLVLYSGCDNTADLYAHTEERPCAFLRNCACKFFKSNTSQSACWMFAEAVGCLYTGDFEANEYWDQLESGLKTEWATIGCIQISHHGSKYNYNNKFLMMSPWHVASAGKRNRYRHPHKVVRENYKDRCPLFVVTEDMSSLAKWSIEKKSLINVAGMKVDLRGCAVMMEWYKERGTSVSFKMEEHDEIPIEWKREGQAPIGGVGVVE